MDEFLTGTFLNSGGAGSDSDANEEGSDLDSEGEEEEDLEGGSDEDDEALPTAAYDSDEDEEEDANDDDGDGIGAQNSRFKDEISAHKAQLEKLKEADPEFYEYLAATDKQLLAFGGGDDSEEEDEEESDEEEEEKEGAEEGKSDGEEVEEDKKSGDKVPAAPEKGTVTLALVDSWCTAALKNASLGAMRSLLRAYRVACHYGDSEDQVQEGLRLGSSAAYNRLMLFVLREADTIFKRILGVDGEELEYTALGKLQRWKKVEPLIKSYIGNTIHLLGK